MIRPVYDKDWAAHRLSAAGAVLSSHSWDAFGNGSSTVPTDDPYANFGAQHGYLRDANGLLRAAG